jgi:hypothetical protein
MIHKILLTTPIFPPKNSGLGNAVQQLAKLIVDQGWKVVVATNGPIRRKCIDPYSGATIEQFNIDGADSLAQPLAGDIHSYTNYLKNSNYMISFRKNVIYFLRRNLMNYIHVLGITYGDYIDENHSYWFDAESQLENICVTNNIDKFNSTTQLEDNSLYNYHHTNYFNENGELKQDNYSFFIKRY